MFIWRDKDGRPVSYTGSFYGAEWDAAVAEYEAKAEPNDKGSAQPKAAEKRSATRKTAASGKED